jgi:hypothetical protein
MSRQTNFCSLNSRGEEFIRENAVKEKIMVSSRFCPHCNKEIIDYEEIPSKVEYDSAGMFCECPLYAYIDKNSGKKFFEYVQVSPWSSGLYEFLALREENDEPILKSLWCDDEIIEIMGE